MRRRMELGAVATYAAFVAAGLVLLPGNWSTVDHGQVFGTVVLGWFISVGYGCVGVLLVLKRQRHRVGLLFLAVAWPFAAQQMLGEAAVRLLVVDPAAQPLGVAFALGSNLLRPAFLIALTALVLVFPERPLDRAGRRLLAVSVVAGTLSELINSVTTTELTGPRDLALAVDNPLSFVAERFAGLVFVFGEVPVLALLVAGVRLVLRFHRSTGVERAQLAWPAYAAAVSLAAFLLSAIPLPVITDFHLLAGVGLALGIPGGCLIAISRYHLFDIDRVVSRTVSYTTLTALLVAVYVGFVTALGRVAPVDSNVGVALATLTVAALVQPLRRRLQRVVDRRFNRDRYDAATTVEEFRQLLRDEIDLDALHGHLLSAVERTVAPASTSLWLRTR
jgi:hypothetical protein